MTSPIPSERPLILLVANPRGRGSRSADALHRTAAMFETGGFRTELVETGSQTGPTPEHQGSGAGSDDASGAAGSTVRWGASLHRRLAQAQERDEAPAAVVAVGGDGMAHTVVSVLMERRAAGGAPVPFGLVPAGTGNDLARHMRLPQRDAEQAAGRVLRRLDEGAQDMDLGRIELPDGTVRWFATVACCGIDAAVSDLAASWSWPRGGVKYLAALPVEVWRYRQPHLGVAVEEPGGRTRLSARRLLMLSIANTSSIGGGLQVVPHADPFDGQLDVLQVRAVSRARILRLLPRLLRGTHLSVPEVSIGPGLSVEIEGPTRLSADGESVGEISGRDAAVITVQPGALPVLF